MRAIIGIGNPGERYKNNRHNVGFQFLDYFAEQKTLEFKPSKFNYYFAEGEFLGNAFVLIKPCTYVNLSGNAVLNCINNYKIVNHSILVVVDDINLETSILRVRKSGGDGGHNGLGSIIYYLNTVDFLRIRIGIGNNFEVGRLSEYVLSNFTENEMKKLNSAFEVSTQLVDNFISGGMDLFLNTYSRLLNKNL